MPKAWQLNLIYNECDVAWECDGADGADKSWQIILCKQLPPFPSFRLCNQSWLLNLLPLINFTYMYFYYS